MWQWFFGRKREVTEHSPALAEDVPVPESNSQISDVQGAKPMSTKPIEQVLIEGTSVFSHLLLGGPGGKICPQRRVSLESFVAVLAQQYIAQRSFSFGLMPVGMTVRDIRQQHGLFVFLLEVEPGVRTLCWLSDDSPVPFGAQAVYRDVTISLPYLYFFVTLCSTGQLSSLHSVYFCNQQLTSLNDQLSECAFYNCSPDSYGVHCWICTQYLPLKGQSDSSLGNLASNFVTWFLGSGFNQSSERHEGTSFWEQAQKKVSDKRVQTIANWERATKQDPRFAVTVPWLNAKRTPLDIYNELTANGSAWNPTSSTDFATLVTLAAAQKGG